jgi:ubiquinone biosynthesis protein
MRLSSIPQLARNINRVREIVTILSRYGLADWFSRLNVKFAKGLFKGPAGQGLGTLTHESRICLALTELGPTFIKLGQMLSTRPDLVGPDLARELSSLQEATPAEPARVVRATVEAELRKPIRELFAEFDDRPMASASIAQAHRARLRDGSWVVLKVQRRDIERRVRNDLDILVVLAELAQEHLGELRQYQPRATAAEFQRTLLRELDFRREERHLQQFLNNFSSDATVRFPRPYPELSTRRVLTMELLEGVRLADTPGLLARGYNPEEVARRGAEVFLEMIFRDGFYHADPHPGNVVVLPGGVIGMLDCGMVGRVDEALREEVEELLLALMHQDASLLTSVITRVGSVPPQFDQAGLGMDVADFMGYYGGQPLDTLDLGNVLTEMTEIIRRYHVLLPSRIALLIKVLVMLEGTSRLLNPRFNLMELIRPYQKKLIWRRLSPRRRLDKLRRWLHEWAYLSKVLPRSLVDILQQVQNGRFDIHLEHKGLEPSVNRLVYGLLTSALFLGSALMLSSRVPPLVGGVSLFGLIGAVVSVMQGLRLMWAIRKSGRLDRRP